MGDICRYILECKRGFVRALTLEACRKYAQAHGDPVHGEGASSDGEFDSGSISTLPTSSVVAASDHGATAMEHFFANSSSKLDVLQSVAAR